MVIDNKDKNIRCQSRNTYNFLLKICYIGTFYAGLARQLVKSTNEELRTIEGTLIKALKKCKFIDSELNCRLSKCARTDKGVHARSNYFSVRLKCKADGSLYEYENILNKIIPSTLRVIYCIQVPMWFDARVDCVYREYKYFLNINDRFDLDSAKNAAKYFEGTHNFINFCKFDSTKNVEYKKYLKKCQITRISNHLICFHISGPSFLWHQIRCIVGSLAAVGKKSLKLELLQEMIDTDQRIDKKYVLAPADGLILWECHYPFLNNLISNLERNDPYRKLIEAKQKEINLIKLLNE